MANSLLLAAGFVLPLLYHNFCPGFYHHGGGSSWYSTRELHGIISLHNEGAFGTCMSACMLSDCCENGK
jgi:Fe-S cluster biogenesis protein NfuA